MALVKVNQFFMNHADIPEGKRVGAYLMYRKAVAAEKVKQPQKIKGVSYAEEADLQAFCEEHIFLPQRLVKLSEFRKQHTELSEAMYWAYIKSGKLKTVRKINRQWYLDREEAEEFARQLEHRGELKAQEAESRQQGMISVFKYAAIHGVDYQQFLRQVKEGLFPCEKAADVYLINKDTPFVRYISLNNYAKEYGLPYAKVKRMAESGQIKTAVKASNGRWYIDAAEEPSFR